MKRTRPATNINMNVDGPRWDAPETSKGGTGPRVFNITFHPDSLPMLRAILPQLHAEGLT